MQFAVKGERTSDDCWSNLTQSKTQAKKAQR